MNTSSKQNFIRLTAGQNTRDPNGSKILWSHRAVAALIDDRLHRIDVERALSLSEVIEDYIPTHRHLPDCLVFATLSDDRPIHPEAGQLARA